MLEINTCHSIKEEYLLDSKITTVDDVFANPDEIVDFMSSTPAPLWKTWESHQGYVNRNGIDYHDRRHNLQGTAVDSVLRFCSELCKQRPVSPHLCTNVFRMTDTARNDIENCCWYPHRDLGYNAVFYLNKDSGTGTNIYEKTGSDIDDIDPDIKEHSVPWRSKQVYHVIKYLPARFNRLVLFDGAKFYHGMHLGPQFFFEDRYTLVGFFRPYFGAGSTCRS